jgi:hypothetical protein
MDVGVGLGTGIWIMVKILCKGYRVRNWFGNRFGLMFRVRGCESRLGQSEIVELKAIHTNPPTPYCSLYSYYHPVPHFTSLHFTNTIPHRNAESEGKGTN